LLREIAELRARIEDAEATIQAIQSGGIDGLIVSGPDGAKVFALEGADYPYRVMLEVLNEGVLTVGPDGCILSCNSRFIKFVNLPIELVLGKPLAGLVTKRDVPKLRTYLEDLTAKSGVISVRLSRNDGTTMPANLSAAAFEVGGLPALCVVVTDLTDVLAAAETQLWLASIVDSSNDAIISKSLDNKILTWNTAAEYIFGFSAQEAIGQPISILVPRERIQDSEILRRKARLGQHIEGYETVKLTKSGARIHVSMTISPLMDANGNATGMSVIARDITERKKAEAELEKHRRHLEAMVQERTHELSSKTDELRATNEELQIQREEMAAANMRLRAHSEMLRKNEERLRLALHAGKMATWDWHIPTDKVIWNDEHYLMLGYAVGAVEPGYDAWISRVHADDRKVTEAAFAAAMNEGIEYNTQFRTCWPDGTIHWHWGLGGFECDDIGKAVRSFGVLLEITVEKEAELHIQELNASLQEHVAIVDAANQELESYSHSVSHDLRTPLRFMNKIAHALLHDTDSHLSHSATKQVNIILQAASEMSALIENLLVFSQVTRVPMKKRRLDLERFFREAVKELEQAQENRSVEIVIQDLAPCQGDRTLLKQVVLNLLANALKFTRLCKKTQITIGCTPMNGEHVFFVQDNGVGFDMNESGLLFVPFRRLHSSDKFEGSGIGLALVKRIIERHGGRIWATGFKG
jgi:PAS domain S-box-containing protein